MHRTDPTLQCAKGLVLPEIPAAPRGTLSPKNSKHVQWAEDSKIHIETFLKVSVDFSLIRALSQRVGCHQRRHAAQL